MLSSSYDLSLGHLLQDWRLTVMAACLAMSLITAPAYTQGSFNSGSTGADGAYAPTASETKQIPDSGIFNFTTINIPTGIEIRFKRNARNTPVIILASGNVTIAGAIFLDGEDAVDRRGGNGGPGGFNGGAGGLKISGFASGITGDGPGGGGGGRNILLANGNNFNGSGGGGGYAIAGANGGQSTTGGGIGDLFGNGGPIYGAISLLPLSGGSGGGGGGGRLSVAQGGAGGGGGGAILIASSGVITFNNGGIYSRGGKGSGADVPFQAGGGGRLRGGDSDRR